MLAYRTVTGSAPTYLKSFLQSYAPTRGLQSTKECCLVVPTQRVHVERCNDLPYQMRSLFNNQLNMADLYTLNSTHTNIPKIKEGRLAAQFWAAFVAFFLTVSLYPV
ncbi:uncharacterized protein LOC127411829 [Myxocyprinus asiaticus]|uniref:uncharacterized protein LOC127411829 n=1 Tax=Myxocyprinus asiaticus TaxID=70543 RepID=UPI002222918A|nr:uncharacterized protein LOC127411829 [Myxocyprinus asiaticus]